jgi:multidrug resistance efflux pump
MNGAQYIPIPWKQRWRRFRFEILPTFGLLAFGAVAVYLWSNSGGMPHTIGEVEAIRVEITSPLEGILVQPPSGPWALFERMEPSQVVAQLDDRPIRAQLAMLTEELGRLRLELDAAAEKIGVAESDRVRTYLTEAVRLCIELEQRRIALLDRQVLVAIDRLEAERTNTRCECLKPLLAKKMISELEMNDAKMRRDEAAKRLAENLKLFAECETQQKDAESRQTKLPGFRAADVPKELAPIKAATAVQQAKIRELEVQISRMTIRAPIGGLICRVHHWPGEAIHAAEPILTLAAEQGRYIVSYIRQEQRIEPKLGMAVDVRIRAPLSKHYATVVEKIGPQVEAVPTHQCRDPKIPEWGLPVRITVPPELAIRPGQLLDVTFKSRGGG